MKKNIKKIYYQGSEGSYSESVLEACFKGSEYVPCDTFKETVGKIANGEYGLLPVENSLVGTVIEAYETLLESNLEVYMEFSKKINHALIGLHGAKIENITKVISHPQALQQCSNFLEGLNIERQPVFDTAGSVMSLLENGSIEIAAIAGAHFEKDKRFTILQNNISNHIENYTRFFLVGKEDPEISEKKDKRSAVLIADDKPGSLLQGLKIFEELKLNLTKLESRPILGSPWEYKFYIDYQNDNNDIDGQLEEKLSMVTKEFKIIGKYSSKDL